MSPDAASTITAASNAFVEEHLAAATALGYRLADLVGDPAAFVGELQGGLLQLADPVVVEGIRTVAPGIGPVLGVRLPLLGAAHRAFRKATKRISTALVMDATDRLLREETSELRWFGMWNLERLLRTDPERTWQLMRRAAREATDWIGVDTLAHPYSAGILGDPRRWAELEQLVFSPSRWERRLVGSTLATLPHGNHPERVAELVVRRGLALVEQLIGDNEPDVQKALSWALRTLAGLDPGAVAAFAQGEAQTARQNADGNRAWVIRDSLTKLPGDTAADLRAELEGIRRRPAANSSSRAAAAAAAFIHDTDYGAASRPVRSPMEA
ncbi:MAG: DNA alkylation repair protein [Candidatus Limnocylindrales bacterium]|jgi:3-methyladenine DNA glycosylase AlkD